MYIVYADESGFSKKTEFDITQPVLVVGGLLLDLTKLNKAIRTYDGLIAELNRQFAPHFQVSELKFADIKEGKGTYRLVYPTINERAALLQEIITKFITTIPAIKFFYCAVDTKEFYKLRHHGHALIHKDFRHPYLLAAYRVVAEVNHFQGGKKNNKGSTFVVFDEQNKYQEELEKLCAFPLHNNAMNEILDVYFGKSHYSKLIQLSDLMVGIMRYYLWRRWEGKAADGWYQALQPVVTLLENCTVRKECFSNDLRQLYRQVELRK